MTIKPSHKIRLAIVTTHPIQYYAPWFALLAKSESIKTTVFYTWSQAIEQNYDTGFKQKISWDIPVLQGYDYQIVENKSKKPTNQTFTGIKTPDLIPQIQKWNANAVLFIGWNYQSHFKAMRFFKNKIPVFFRGDSHLLDEENMPFFKKIIRRFALRTIYSFIDHAFYVGIENKNYYLKHGLTRNQLSFTPHAIDNERFIQNANLKEKEAAERKKQLKIDEQKIVVLFCGKFEAKKNPEIIIKAAQKFQNTPLFFLMIGNGELEKKLKEMSKNLKNVLFLPFQNQSRMPIIYRMGDIFVLPSVGPYETWGLAVNEAMACKRTVIVSKKAGCANDLVKKNENGYIFDPFKEEQFFEILKKILKNPKKLTIEGENSLKKIQDWSFQKICQTIEQQVSFRVNEFSLKNYKVES